MQYRDIIYWQSCFRLFQNTNSEGDGKMQFHYTVANIVRADGVQHHPDTLSMGIEGAPAETVLFDLYPMMPPVITRYSRTHVDGTMAKSAPMGSNRSRSMLLANQRDWLLALTAFS